MKSNHAVGLLLAAVTLAGCKGAREEVAAPTAEVVTVAAAMRPLEETVAGYGQVEFAPPHALTLVVEVESQVVAVLAAAGARVRAGDGLLRLRPSAQTRLDLERSAREAAQAGHEAERMKRLSDEGLATNSEAAASRSQADTVASLRDSLRNRTGGGGEYLLRAPRDGIVDALTAQPGDLLAAGATVARIGDPAWLQARIGLEAADAGRVATGAAARVEALGGAPVPMDGRVTSVERRLDKDAHLAAALVALPAATGVLAGVPVRARITVTTRTAVAVPREALVRDADQTAVYVAADGHARRRVVEAGIEDGGFVEVRTGLKSGETVVTTGNHELTDGMAVRVAAPPAAKGAP